MSDPARNDTQVFATAEVRLKRDLWDGLLREAYGEEVGEDSLFLQHTYLAIVVKTIAARVLDLPVSDPERLLSVVRGGSQGSRPNFYRLRFTRST